MLRLELISLKEPELILLAKWRNLRQATLRSHEFTMAYNQKEWLTGSRLRGDKFYFIYNDLDFIGYCGINNINRANNIGELGLLINPDIWEFSYGSEACQKLLDIAFNILKLNCIYI